jgi:hypothetical protein
MEPQINTDKHRLRKSFYRRERGWHSHSCRSACGEKFCFIGVHLWFLIRS